MSLARRVLALLDETGELLTQAELKERGLDSTDIAHTLQRLKDDNKIVCVEVPRRRKWGPRKVQAFCTPQHAAKYVDIRAEECA